MLSSRAARPRAKGGLAHPARGREAPEPLRQASVQQEGARAVHGVRSEKSQRLGEDCPVSRLALMIPFWVLGDHCAPLGLNRELGCQPLRGRGSRTTWQLSQRGPWSSPRPPSSVVSGRSWHPERAGLAQDTQPAGVACGATARLCLAKPADLGESAGRGQLCPGRCLVTLSHVESRAASSRAGEWGVG